MSLPIKTTLEDILEVCRYLATKPTGSTVKEGKAVIDPKRFDGRKLSGLKAWGLIAEEADGDRLKVTEQGRFLIKDETQQATVLTEVIRNCAPYSAIVERAAHQNVDSMTATEVAAHWHEHFADQVSEAEQTLNGQAVCFFQVVMGAKLGTLIVGRRGQPTRISFNVESLRAYIGKKPDQTSVPAPPNDTEPTEASAAVTAEQPAPVTSKLTGQGIFVAHGKNKKPLEQLKKILEQFKIPFKVAVDEPNLGRPIPGKVRQIMESCNCAILIFTADEEFRDKGGNTIWRPSENVIYELGATGYLYDNRIVIMKEEGVTFPSNFSDIGRISFEKDQLEAKAMDILKELIGFGIVKMST